MWCHITMLPLFLLPDTETMKAILHKSARPLTPGEKTLLVIGDGRTMPDDVYTAFAMSIAFDMACIGRSIKQWPYAAHWFNADGETAIAWAKQIRETGAITHTLGEVDGFDVDWEVVQPDYHYRRITGEGGRLHGSSAMFATLAGLAMGYESILLAGCPLDTNGHWYFEPESPETFGPIWLGLDYQAWIDFALLPDSKKVKSLSGYTKKILGAR